MNDTYLFPLSLQGSSQPLQATVALTAAQVAAIIGGGGSQNIAQTLTVGNTTNDGQAMIFADGAGALTCSLFGNNAQGALVVFDFVHNSTEFLVGDPSGTKGAASLSSSLTSSNFELDAPGGIGISLGITSAAPTAATFTLFGGITSMDFGGLQLKNLANGVLATDAATVGQILANPMTTVGDTIYGGASGVATRLAAGSNGQVLTLTTGIPSWATPVTGFANPMTAIGDLILGTTAGAATNLAIGSTGQVLTVSGGTASWATPVSRFANPMTTEGDIIAADPGGTAIRLGVGTAGQVLTVSSGARPAWQTSTGLINPMTTASDLIVASTGGLPSRLGIGTNGQVLTVASGTPSWQTNSVGSKLLGVLTSATDITTGTTFSDMSGLSGGVNFVLPSNGINLYLTFSAVVACTTTSTAAFQIQIDGGAVGGGVAYVVFGPTSQLVTVSLSVYVGSVNLGSHYANVAWKTSAGTLTAGTAAATGAAPSLISVLQQ